MASSCAAAAAHSREYYHYILMITGQNAKQDIAHALESGADDCLSKPFEEPELRARLMVANRILSLQDELIQTREDLRVQATRDALTGLWNRLAFLDLFTRELDRADRCKSRRDCCCWTWTISRRSTTRTGISWETWF